MPVSKSSSLVERTQRAGRFIVLASVMAHIIACVRIVKQRAAKGLIALLLF